MQEEVFNEWVRGRTCTSCAIIRQDTLAFILGWSQTEDMEASDVSNFYFLHYLPNEEGIARKKDTGAKFKGDTSRKLAVNHAAEDLLCMGLSGSVFFHSPQVGKGERSLSNEEIKSVVDVGFIGRHFYAAGRIRSVLRRDSEDQWTDIAKDIKVTSPKGSTARFGFSSMDGFSESDMYAVGGHGDAWRFDGKKWHQLDLPTNQALQSVCCASDGYVYIGGRGHLMLRGREDRWEILHETETNRWFMQIIEFKGRLFAVDEWGSHLYEITEKGISVLDTGDFMLPPTSCLCMATGHDMLLVAGLESASIFDGSSWRSVFRSPELNEVLHAQDMLEQTNQTLKELNKGLDSIDLKR